jgi:ubiquinone/menaquinone biosynthesis C-methylase UbiE
MASFSERDHYSYRVYADGSTARAFDQRRFGGPIGELVASEQARVLRDLVGPIADRPVLDVGTGTGRAAILLTRDGAHVTGVDASEEMLAIARGRTTEEHLDVRFLQGDAHHLEFPDRSFDVVVSLRVLMHAARWQVCVAEMCRVAERRVVVDFPSLTSFALLEAAGRRVTYSLGARTEPYRVLSTGAIAREFARANFRVRTVHRQFLLPIALHKAIGSPSFTSTTERLFHRVGLMRVFGSPVTLVAERCES